jgi:hypothetical protein
MKRGKSLFIFFVCLTAASRAGFAEMNPIDQSRIVHPSASFLDVSARRAARHPGPPWESLLTQPVSDSNLGGNATLYAAPVR